jgi:hypothetical protein
MTTTIYRTVVTKLPRTPLGLLPERWIIEHHCSTCRQKIPPAELLAHARSHDHYGAPPASYAATATNVIQPEGGTIE